MDDARLSPLVDPELVNTECSIWNNLDCVERLAHLSSYKRLYAGQKTKGCIDALMLELSQDYEKLRGQFAMLGPGEPLMLFAPLYQVSLISGSQPGRRVEVKACSYKPRFGADENHAILQADLDQQDIDSIVLVTDGECWPFRWRGVVRKGESLRYLHCDDAEERYYRLLLEYEIERVGSYRPFIGYAKKSFSRLVFSDTALQSFVGIKEPPREFARMVLHHLSALNDSAPEIWREELEASARIARMAGLDVTCSPESPNTHGSPKKMRQRDYEFGGSCMRCEWHTKIRHNHGRIHFCVKGELVYVGGYECHLET